MGCFSLLPGPEPVPRSLAEVCVVFLVVSRIPLPTVRLLRAGTFVP